MDPDEGAAPASPTRRRHRRLAWTGALAIACLTAGGLTWSAAADRGDEALVPAMRLAPTVLPESQRAPSPLLCGTLLTGAAFDPTTFRGRVAAVVLCTGKTPACADESTLVAQLPSSPSGYGRTTSGPNVASLAVVPDDSARALGSSLSRMALSLPILRYADGTLSPAWELGPDRTMTVVLDTQGRIAARFPAGVSRADLLDAVARISAGPAGLTDGRARDAAVTCDGVTVPTRDLATPAHAERGSSDASVLLRTFLARPPAEGAGGPSPAADWLQVVARPDELAFAHRVGTIGVDSLIILNVADGRVAHSRVTTCSNVLSRDGTPSEPINDAMVSGSTVVLRWANERCDGRTDLGDRVRRIDVTESAGSVHLMLVTGPNPAGRPSASLPGYYCLSDGSTESRSTVRLGAPLGDRTLYDDSSIDPIPVTIQRQT